METDPCSADPADLTPATPSDGTSTVETRATLLPIPLDASLGATLRQTVDKPTFGETDLRSSHQHSGARLTAPPDVTPSKQTGD